MAKKKDKGAQEKAAEEQPKRGAHAKPADESAAPVKKEEEKPTVSAPEPEPKSKPAQHEKSPKASKAPEAEKPQEAKKTAKAEKAKPAETAPVDEAPAAQPTRGFVMPKGRIGAGRSIKKSVKVASSAPTPPAGYVPAFQSPDEAPKKTRKGLKIFGIVMGSLVGLVAIAYFVGVFIFMGRFFPNSTIIGLDISMKTPDEVHEMFHDIMADYSFEVEGPGLNLTLDATEMGMALDTQHIADGLLSEMNPWAWPYEIFQRHDDTEDLVSTLENTRLADTLTKAVEEANRKGVPPQDAFVSYDGASSRYTIVPEVEGNTLLADVVIEEVTRGTVNFAPKVELSEAVIAQPAVTQDDPSLAAARDEANKYLDGALSLTMAGVEKMAVTRDEIASHITVGDDLSVTYDPEPLVEAVQEQVNAMDTTGAERSFTRPDGKQITVKGGDYGWITDSQATADAVREALLAGTGGALEIVMKQNAAMAPDENGRDFGARYIDVDLSEQHARLYAEDGSIVWESDIVSGKPADGRNTPQGTYYIKTNDGRSVLRGYKPDGTKDYETNVDYWMPFKDNSVGFHDASWQPTFGGDWYVGNGSHGCVNLPVDKARELHEIIEVGDVVVVHE